MGLISAIKAVLGLGDSRDQGRDGTGGTDVTVEREADAGSERAVKETDAATSDGATDDGGDETADDEGAELTFETDTGDGTEVESGDGGGEGGSEDGEPVDEIKGIGPAYAERLAEAGVHTVADLAEADAAELDEAIEVGENRLQGWIDRAEAR